MTNATSGHEQAYPAADPDLPFELVFAWHSQAKPDEAYTRTSWDCWTFEYVISGKGQLTIDGQSHAIRQDGLYVLPKGKPHHYQADHQHPWQKLYAVVNGPLVPILLNTYGLTRINHVPDLKGEPLFRQLLELWHDHGAAMHHHAAIVFHELLTLIAQHLVATRPAHSTPVQRAMAYVHQHVESPLTMEGIARHAGCSAPHLTRLFRREIGIAPYDYLLQQRIQVAKNLLRLTQLSITQISERLSYADACHFSNAFKKSVGQSPSEYRTN